MTPLPISIQSPVVKPHSTADRHRRERRSPLSKEFFYWTPLDTSGDFFKWKNLRLPKPFVRLSDSPERRVVDHLMQLSWAQFSWAPLRVPPRTESRDIGDKCGGVKFIPNLREPDCSASDNTELRKLTEFERNPRWCPDVDPEAHAPTSPYDINFSSRPKSISLGTIEHFFVPKIELEWKYVNGHRHPIRNGGPEVDVRYEPGPRIIIETGKPEWTTSSGFKKNDHLSVSNPTELKTAPCISIWHTPTHCSVHRRRGESDKALLDRASEPNLASCPDYSAYYNDPKARVITSDDGRVFVPETIGREKHFAHTVVQYGFEYRSCSAAEFRNLIDHSVENWRKHWKEGHSQEDPNIEWAREHQKYRMVQGKGGYPDKSTTASLWHLLGGPFANEDSTLHKTERSVERTLEILKREATGYKSTLWTIALLRTIRKIRDTKEFGDHQTATYAKPIEDLRASYNQAIEQGQVTLGPVPFDKLALWNRIVSNALRQDVEKERSEGIRLRDDLFAEWQKQNPELCQRTDPKRRTPEEQYEYLRLTAAFVPENSREVKEDFKCQGLKKGKRGNEFVTDYSDRARCEAEDREEGLTVLSGFGIETPDESTEQEDGTADHNYDDEKEQGLEKGKDRLPQDCYSDDEKESDSFGFSWHGYHTDDGGLTEKSKTLKDPTETKETHKQSLNPLGQQRTDQLEKQIIKQIRSDIPYIQLFDHDINNTKIEDMAEAIGVKPATLRQQMKRGRTYMTELYDQQTIERAYSGLAPDERRKGGHFVLVKRDRLRLYFLDTDKFRATLPKDLDELIKLLKELEPPEIASNCDDLTGAALQERVLTQLALNDLLDRAIEEGTGDCKNTAAVTQKIKDIRQQFSRVSLCYFPPVLPVSHEALVEGLEQAAEKEAA